MATKSPPTLKEQNIFAVCTECMPRICEDSKHFRLVPLLCHSNGCEIPRESSGPLQQNSKRPARLLSAVPRTDIPCDARQGHANTLPLVPQHSGVGLLNLCGTIQAD